MKLRRRKRKSQEELRVRLIRETELALYIGLRFPKRVPRIPAVEVGQGSGFDRAFAEEFWERMLGDMSGLYRMVHRNPHLMDPFAASGKPRGGDSS